MAVDKVLDGLSENDLSGAAALSSEDVSKIRQHLLDWHRKWQELRRREQQALAAAEDWKRMALQQSDRCLHLEGRLGRLQAEGRALERSMDYLLGAACSDCPHEVFCEGQLQLRERCVLYLGSRGAYVSKFRALVESRKACFVHCDGGVGEGFALKKQIQNADLVMCSLDKVTQSTATKVRRHCNYYLKPLIELAETTLPSFADGLVRAER